MPTLKFIDLFAGLGGFHLALEQLGCRCVFASEIKPELRGLYEKNFGMECVGDIYGVEIEGGIPSHDILCGGFPCQPFSQAGKREGFNDSKNRGNLFNKIMEILREKKPEYVMLENVPNLKGHDGGRTYSKIRSELEELYEVRDDIISPHFFGIPQHRARLYIVGRLKDRGGLKGFEFPQHEKAEKCDICQIVDNGARDYRPLKEITRRHIGAWQNFLDLAKARGAEIPTFPIWAMEFGATYDYEHEAPCYQPLEELKKAKGNFGEPVDGIDIESCLLHLPVYARERPKGGGREFAEWKKKYIGQNRKFYLANKDWIDQWTAQIRQPGFENSHQKFEWNCGAETEPSMKDKILQFRASGLRVKKRDFSPALVLTTTQVPILMWVTTPEGEQGRYMTTKEAAALQCMQGLKHLPESDIETFKALGNAVNVEVVKRIAEKLLKRSL